MVLFSCLINVIFSQIFDWICCPFFKCSLNFRANALQLRLNKVWSTNFVKFRLQSTSSKIEQAFEKDVIFNFTKILCGSPLTLCLTGELWPLRYIWHHNLRVTHCQSSAMTFIFTQYSFCNSFRHGLLTSSTVQAANNY